MLFDDIDKRKAVDRLFAMQTRLRLGGLLVLREIRLGLGLETLNRLCQNLGMQMHMIIAMRGEAFKIFPRALHLR